MPFRTACGAGSVPAGRPPRYRMLRFSSFDGDLRHDEQVNRWP